MKKVTGVFIRINEELHEKILKHCFENKISVNKYITNLLEKEFNKKEVSENN